MRATSAPRAGTWWRPDRLAWWIGVLFAIGSTLFFVPAVAALGSDADWIGPAFFAGSIFFTSASALQLLAATEVPHRARPARERHLTRPRAWMPHHADWLSALIQFPGTVLFNVNTYEAMDRMMNAQQSNVRVWGPDMLGSACFLVSSLMAFANVEHEWLSWRPRDLDWRIGAANLLGAVAFGVSALTSYVEPASGREVNEAVTNAMTAVGAVGFFAGALLLLPQASLSPNPSPEP